MQPLLVVGLGLALVLVATLPRIVTGLRGRRLIPAAGAAGLMVLLMSSVALATHTELTSADYASVSNPWNGKKVYLSSPRHSDSGSRGECGWLS